MSNETHDCIFPKWEPIPWDAPEVVAAAQAKGFEHRSCMPLVWTKLDWENFPEEGIFGKTRDWFISEDVAYVTTFESEDLILFQNLWYGFPDPPEWGLASRAAGNVDAKWEMWGHFPTWPQAWGTASTSDEK